MGFLPTTAENLVAQLAGSFGFVIEADFEIVPNLRITHDGLGWVWIPRTRAKGLEWIGLEWKDKETMF